jgi:hypothetical protein
MTRRCAVLFVVALVVASAAVAGQQRALGAVVADLRAKMAAGYGAKAVTLLGTRIRIALDAPKVTQSGYLTALDFTCVWLGSDATRVSEIAIVNRSEGQGYVFESPARCAELQKMPGERRRFAVLAATHVF